MIRTDRNQLKERLDDTLIDKRRHTNIRKDRLGNKIVPGIRVAFNYSGEVASGIVEKITGTETHIKRDEGFGGKNPISKVKNASSILVLNDEQEQELLIAYRDSYDELKKQWDESFTEQEAALKRKYAAFIADLRNAWDIDEAKMLVEHHFGDFVE